MHCKEIVSTVKTKVFIEIADTSLSHMHTHTIADSYHSLNLFEEAACVTNEENHPMCKHKGKSQALGK